MTCVYNITIDSIYFSLYFGVELIQFHKSKLLQQPIKKKEYHLLIYSNICKYLLQNMS